MKTILLLNGPWNGYCIQDSGAVPIRMTIIRGGMVPGAEVGMAIYEPDRSTPGKERTYWIENIWGGRIDEVIKG